MNSKDLYHAIGSVDDDILERSEAAVRARKQPVWLKWGAMAACLCLIAAAAFWGLDARAANNSEALLEVDTLPPEGLSLTIVDAAPDDAEFLIANESEFQVDYGYANRVERYDGTAWVSVTTESAGIFPAQTVTIRPGMQVYGMIGLVSKQVILEPGTYRYLLVVNVYDGDDGAYPVVLRAEFEIE